MDRMKVTTALFAAAIGMVALVPNARADAWDKKTIVTISGQVEVPGAILEPGTYVFRLLDEPSDRHIVTIQNERMNHTYATILAIPNYRLQPTSKSQFTFWETPAGQAPAMRAWFYPADNFGQEFAYPKGRFTQVSQVRHTETTPAPVVAEATPPPAEQPEVAAVAQAETPAEPPAPQPEIAQNTPPAEPPPAAIENTTPATLPQTSGMVPLMALVGLVSVGVAFLLGAFSKRMG